MNKTIDRSAMDAILYGISKSLDFLGEQREAILERMGEVMLEYLIAVRKVKSPEKPEVFSQSLKKLLTKNGYSPRVPIHFKGTPQSPSIPNFVDYLKPKSRGGGKTSGSHTKGRRKVDWVLYEMVLYGMTKALDDELGAQGQLILDRIGTEMLNYLIELGEIEPSDDVKVFFQHVEDFFLNAGFARSTEFKLEGSPPNALVATWKYARYFSNVLKRLRNEGSVLYSCPVCLAGESILSKAQGLKFQNAVELRFLPGEKVFYRHKVYQPIERFTEEDAQKISQMNC